MSRTARFIQDISKHIVKVTVGDITLTECEYLRIKSMLREWDIDVAEFCKYCLVSITKAHEE